MFWDKDAPVSKPIQWTYNGHVYKLFNEPISWKMAAERCRSMKGHMVSIESKAENDCLYSNIKDIEGVIYIGLSDSKRETIWVWSNGSKASFNMWPSDQPEENHGDNHYAALNPAKSKDCWILPDKAG
jgi:hypothetical protein